MTARCALPLLVLAACTSSTDENAHAEPDAGMDSDAGGTDPAQAEAPTIAFACPGGTIAEGMNEIMVGAQLRTFYAEFPSDMSGPIGIVFSWHGYNDAGSDGDAAIWRSLDQVDADADPSNPVVVVTPFDLDFEVPVGLDWQHDEPTSATNVDLAFFEAMVGCLNEQYDIDPARIHSYGFSAGSVTTSLLHSAYPDLVSSVVCVSGMWFNDQAQRDMVQLIPVVGSWPTLDPTDDGTVLLTHGGPTDVTVLGVANLENMAQAALPFLAASNRVVVDCPHTGGHVLHPELTAAQVMRFFADHPAGASSPYQAGALSELPSGCEVQLP